MIKPSIFVSSVVKGYEEYRQAAARAIERAGGYPILVNENFPSLATSSRNACLDGVASSDIYLVIIGERGGSVAPSGKLVVEEEYEEAKRLRLPIYVFLHEIERDRLASHLAERLSDYVDGNHRRSFLTSQHLEQLIEEAMRPAIAQLSIPTMNTNNISKLLTQDCHMDNEPSLRIIVSPERHEEILDPMSLESDSLFKQLNQIAHDSEPPLFDYRLSKTRSIMGDSIILHQVNHAAPHVDEVRLCISEQALVMIDATLTEQDDDPMSFWRSYVIDENRIRAVLHRGLSFVSRLFDALDPYKRHERFYFNVSLINLGERAIERDPQPRNTFTHPPFRDGRPVVAFRDPRLVSRADLAQPLDEVERSVTKICRAVTDLTGSSYSG